jgi:glycosyltransferase involved in cell wall biosynthesis
MRRLLYLSSDPGVPVLGHKGASVHVRSLVRALARKGPRLVLASPRVGYEGEHLGAPVELVEIEGVLPKQHDAGSLQAVVDRQAAQVLELVRRYRADAIYERFSLFTAAGVRAAAAAGIRHVLEVNAPLRAEALSFRTLPHPEIAAELEEETLIGTDRVLAVSPTLAELLVSSGVAADKIEVVANAIDPDQFAGRGRRRSDTFTVGFAGSLKPWHGIDVLVEAFRLAHAEVPLLRLEIAGDGPAAAALEAATLPDAVVRHGQLTHEETIRTMTRWHVGVAPFHRLDDFYFSPLKLAEYMAAGVCAVASDLPELRSALGEGKRGVLVEPGSPGALAGALVELARNRKRAAELGAHGRAYALGTLSWARNADRALAALRREQEIAA